MTAMDWFAAVCFVISMRAAYIFGVATERDRVREAAQLTADIAELRGVTRIDTRRRAS